MNTRNALTILAVAGLAATATAQDSISNLGTGLPGDSPDAFATGDQVDRFVADLIPITTSLGNEFGFAPIHKTPDVDGPGGFFGSLWSAQAMSQNILETTLANPVSFDFWNTAGEGVTANNAPASSSESLSGTVVQQSIVFAGFGGDSQTLNGSIIQIDPSDSSRLYITRVLAGNNQSAPGAGNRYQAGTGGVDASGNAYFRLDDFGTAGAAVSGNNYVRIRLGDRNSASLNEIGGPGITASDAGATDGLLVGSGVTHTVPQALPADLFGGNGLVAGPNFDSEYRFGGASPTTTTLTHLTDPSAPSAVDHRGGIAYTPNTFSGFGANAGVSTLAILAKGGTPNPSETETINVWSVDASGAVLERRLFDPTQGILNDPCDGSTINTTGAFSMHHLSQTAFRGGSGQVDVQVLPNGDLAGVVTLGLNQGSGSVGTDPDNIIVAFTETPGGTVTEVPVAWTSDPVGSGTLQGKSFTTVGGDTGYLLPIDIAFGGVNGPSMSAPAFDSAGNVWFVAPQYIDVNGNGQFDGLPTEDADSALFRAVYDAANNCYSLEVVLQNGEVFTGPNSGTEFQIQFLQGTSDSNSVSSGTLWSSNVSAQAALGQNPGDFAAADPNTLGGLITMAEIVYDAEGDMDFEDPTAGGGNPASTDEAYNVALYVGAITSALCSPADINGDGALTPADVSAFVSAFGGGDLAADINDDGSLTPADVSAFVAAFQAGGC